MICSECFLDKNINDYFLINNQPKTKFCKKCTGLKYRKKRYEYRAANKEKVRLWKKRDRVKNVANYLYNAAKLRAKNFHREFNLDKSDIVIPEYCPILGIKIDNTKFGRYGTGPSVDRIDNSRGYTKDNIIIISDRANVLKSDSTRLEREKIYCFYKWLISIGVLEYNQTIDRLVIEKTRSGLTSYNTRNDRLKYNEYQREYRRNHYENILFYNAKQRAKKRNLEFTINKSDIIIPKKCPVLGIELCFNHKNFDYRPALDRIDNMKGYIPNNIIVVSYRVNRIKADATLDELKLLAEYIS